jgi:hypothetical protein
VKKVIILLAVCLVVLPVVLVVGFLSLYQYTQRLAYQQRPLNVLRGIVIDQNGQPVDGVEMSFMDVWQTHLIPLPFTPGKWTASTNATVTSSNGSFVISFRGDRLGLLSANKSGYKLSSHSGYFSWQHIQSSITHTTSVEMHREDAVRDFALIKREFSAVPFPNDGRLFFNFSSGEIVTPDRAEILFDWQQLAASTNYGRYGKWTIRSVNGGIRLSEQERLFAPRDGYEDGVVFFFDPERMNAYMKYSRIEFFLRLNDNRMHARVYAQLDRQSNRISIRVRVNPSGALYLGDSVENYAIGVYGSLSGFALANEPWWLRMQPERAQLLIEESRLRQLIKEHGQSGGFLNHFAGYRCLPADIGEAIADACVKGDLNLSKEFAQNIWIERSVAQRVAAATIPWVSNNFHSSMMTPIEVRDFLATE